MNDEKLLPWPELKKELGLSDTGILLGNGFSCAVWDKFKEPSLYKKACDHQSEHPLSKEDKDLFNKDLKTTSFERVLLALSTARMINKRLNQDYSFIQERYESIKSALGYAVRSVHIPWTNATGSGVLNKIRKELLNYPFVYTTNYDLLIYWAVMSEDKGKGFKDYFFKSDDDNYFDISNTEIRKDPATKILYLHGGLHLERSTSGKTIKRKYEENTNLLDSFGQKLSGRQEETVPLLIAEGDAEDKLKSIYSSDYLSFTYAQFAQHKGALVVFEHSLEDSDQHILDAIKRAKPSRIAISISSKKSPQEIIYRKAELRKKLDQPSKLDFFEAETHPLNSSEMRVDNT
jgi:hypothetical protein